MGEAVDGDTPALVRFRMRGCQAPTDDVHLGPCSLEGHAGLELGAGAEPAKITLRVRRLKGEWRPELGRSAIERPAFRKDADDGVRLAVQPNVAPQKRGIG